MQAGSSHHLQTNAKYRNPIMTGIYDILIIGSGFSGLAMGHRLLQEGRRDFLILERDGQLGGTWRDNRYPGCACDVPSHLYSLSGFPKPDWPRRYATHDQIWHYLEHLGQALLTHLRFGAEVQEARFNESDACWYVLLAGGETLRARILVAGLGPLNRPALPDIAGLDRFAGPCFHTMHWPRELSLEGRRVAIIGTGASAIQIVSAIASRVSHLTVFQRSAPWVVPKGDRPYTALAQQAFRRIPGWQRLYRAQLYAFQELRGLAFLYPALMRVVAHFAKRRLARTIPDPTLRTQLTPTHVMGCKRILLSDDYHDTLQRPNVTLVTDPLRQVTPEGLVTEGGQVHAADVLVLATGYQHALIPESPRIHGQGGVTLQELWAGRRSAYLGTAVARMPNFFLLGGPNTGLGHNSVLFMMEAQVHWILQALKAMDRAGARTLCVSDASYRHMETEMSRRSRSTVWQSGCRSWYLDAQGANTALWPGLSAEFWLRTRRFNSRHFILETHDRPIATDPGRYCAGPPPAASGPHG